jgi:hypothetical protein
MTAARWNYLDTEPFPYDDEEAYKIGMELLADCEVVEDWGCGTAWAKRYRKGKYVGVDSAPGYADVVADLRLYHSDVDGIFMRGVLEHNAEGWESILDNALDSCQQLVLVMFTPFTERTTVIYTSGDGWKDLSFAEKDIEDRFGDRLFTKRAIDNNTQFGQERIYHVT